MENQNLCLNGPHCDHPFCPDHFNHNPWEGQEDPGIFAAEVLTFVRSLFENPQQASLGISELRDVVPEVSGTEPLNLYPMAPIEVGTPRFTPPPPDLHTPPPPDLYNTVDRVELSLFRLASAMKSTGRSILVELGDSLQKSLQGIL